MNPGLLVVVVAAGVTIVTATYFSLRYFTTASRPPVEVKPKRNPHDAATTAQLKHFFQGKQCASCSRPIPPVHAGELRPGLLNASTHEPIAWEDIPTADLSATLDSHLTICSSCVTIETFRRQYPERGVDRHHPIANSSH